jgi:hypothetical protein
LFVSFKTYYTTLTDVGGPKGKIQVISRNKLKSDPLNYAELEERFAKIAKAKQEKDQKEEVSVDVPNKNIIFFVTHFNVFLYATCFFIQVGTMPVKLNVFWIHYASNLDNITHFTASVFVKKPWGRPCTFWPTSDSFCSCSTSWRSLVWEAW